MKAFSAFLLSVLLAVSASCCWAEEKIVLGAIWSQVGVAAPIGQGAYKGSQLAVKMANEAGGLFGHAVELAVIDGQSDPTAIANASTRLTKELKVLAACGLEDDSLVSAAGPIFQEEKTVFLAGTATTPTIPSMGDFVFMAAFGDNYQGRAAAKYAISKLGWKKTAVIWDNASAYSTDIARYYMEAFKEYSGDANSVVHQEMYQTGDTNFTAQLTRLKTVMAKESVDGILIAPPFPQDAPIIAKQAISLGLKLPMIITDGGDDQSVIEVGGSAVEGTIISTHFAADNPLTENAKNFVEAYRAEYNAEPGAFECLGFDAIRVLLESIEVIGKEKWEAMDLAQRRVALRDSIQNTHFKTTTMPMFYPDPDKSNFPRVTLKPIVFKVIKNAHRIYHGSLSPEEL